MPHSYRATYHNGSLSFLDEKPVNEDGDVIVTFLQEQGHKQESKRLEALNSLNQIFQEAPKDETISFENAIDRKPLLAHRNINL